MTVYCGKKASFCMLVANSTRITISLIVSLSWHHPGDSSAARGQINLIFHSLQNLYMFSTRDTCRSYFRWSHETTSLFRKQWKQLWDRIQSWLKSTLSYSMLLTALLQAKLKRLAIERLLPSNMRRLSDTFQQPCNCGKTQSSTATGRLHIMQWEGVYLHHIY